MTNWVVTVKTAGNDPTVWAPDADSAEDALRLVMHAYTGQPGMENTIETIELRKARPLYYGK